MAEGYRPPLLKGLPPALVEVIEACWKGDAQLRPTAREVVERLEAVRASGERASASMNAVPHGAHTAVEPMACLTDDGQPRPLN